MKKLTNDEKTKLLEKALILCERAIFLLDECYNSHYKEQIKRDLNN
jgi:hypothetical protein